jgi:hypothetical protein
MCVRYPVINISDHIPFLRYCRSRRSVKDFRDGMSDSWVSVSHKGSRLWSRVGGTGDRREL